MNTPERAGWYDDPEDESRLRYFDGIIWSDRTVPRQTPQRQAAPEGDPDAATRPRGDVGTDVYGRPVSGGPQPGQHPQQQPGWGAPPQGWGAPQHSQQGWGGPQQQGWNQQPHATQLTTQDGQPLAGYGERAGAYLIDTLVLGLLNLVCAGWAWWLFMADYLAYSQDLMGSGQGDAQPPTFSEAISLMDYRFFFIAIGISLVISAIYNVGFLAARGATPGKLLVGISVRRVDAPGRLGVGVSFMRMVLPLALKVLSALTCLLDVVGRAVDLLWPLKDERRQALHDKIAGTQVVKGKQVRPTSTQDRQPHIS